MNLNFQFIIHQFQLSFRNWVGGLKYTQINRIFMENKIDLIKLSVKSVLISKSLCRLKYNFSLSVFHSIQVIDFLLLLKSNSSCCLWNWSYLFENIYSVSSFILFLHLRDSSGIVDQVKIEWWFITEINAYQSFYFILSHGKIIKLSLFFHVFDVIIFSFISFFFTPFQFEFNIE